MRPAAQVSEDEPKHVTVATPRRMELPTVAKAWCTLQALNPINVSAKVTGSIADTTLAAAGDRVKKGQVLAVIESTDRDDAIAKDRDALFKAQAKRREIAAKLNVADAVIREQTAKVSGAKAAILEAEGEVRSRSKQAARVQALFEQKAVSDAALDEANEKVHSAEAKRSAAVSELDLYNAAEDKAKAERGVVEAEMETAESVVNLAKEKIKHLQAMAGSSQVVSPLDGIVLKRNGDVNSMTSPNDQPALFVVARTDVLVTEVNVPESDALLVDADDPVQFTIEARRDHPINGRIRRIAAEIENTHLRVQIEVPNVDGKLRIGMTGEATITLGPPHMALTIPAAAVRPTNLGAPAFGCFLVVDGRATWTFFSARHTMGDRFEILDGIKEADRVITFLAENGRLVFGPNHLGSLGEGQLVEVVDLPQPERYRPDYGGMNGRMGGMGGGFR
jgi:multidrug efflux pump subunit AcrA (membrane-fusion protein)